MGYSAGWAGSIPGQGAKTPHDLQPRNQNIEWKQYCNKFNKDFKNGPHPKKSFRKEIVLFCFFKEKKRISHHPGHPASWALLPSLTISHHPSLYILIN